MRRQVRLSEVLLYGFFSVFFGFISALVLYCLLYYIEDKGSVMFPFIVCWGYEIVTTCVFFHSIIRCIKTHRVIKYGKKDVCIISRYAYTHRRYSRRCYMVVTYNGEDGTYYENKFLVSFDTISIYPTGSAIECLTYDKDCYVNPYLITIVKDKKKKSKYEL